MFLSWINNYGQIGLENLFFFLELIFVEILFKVEEHSKLSKPGLLLKDTVAKMLRLLSEQPQILEQCGRDLAVTLAHTYISALLLEHAHRFEAEQDLCCC